MKQPVTPHEHVCTLCDPARVYSCVKRHRVRHMPMLNVWYMCPFKRHAGEKQYREAQSGVVSFEHPRRVA